MLSGALDVEITWSASSSVPAQRHPARSVAFHQNLVDGGVQASRPAQRAISFNQRITKAGRAAVRARQPALGQVAQGQEQKQHRRLRREQGGKEATQPRAMQMLGDILLHRFAEMDDRRELAPHLPKCAKPVSQRGQLRRAFDGRAETGERLGALDDALHFRGILGR